MRSCLLPIVCVQHRFGRLVWCRFFYNKYLHSHDTNERFHRRCKQSMHIVQWGAPTGEHADFV